MYKNYYYRIPAILFNGNDYESVEFQTPIVSAEEEQHGNICYQYCLVLKGEYNDNVHINYEHITKVFVN